MPYLPTQMIHGLQDNLKYLVGETKDIKRRVMDPLLGLVCPCFRNNVIVACKIVFVCVCGGGGVCVV